MRVLALITYTDCENKWRSIEAAGHEVIRVEQYDNRPHDRHRELCDLARSLKPDFTVMVGAVEQYHGRPCPQNDVIKELNDIAPMVLMCNDAADPPWWTTLESYIRDDCFSIIVSIDGRLDTPLQNYNKSMVALTPIDSRSFKRGKYWNEKTIKCGLIGGMGHGVRGKAIQELSAKGVLTYIEGSSGPGGRPYDEMAKIMQDFKIAFVHPETGSGQSAHVKGRVVEAGFAGAVVLDHFDSPTGHWFTDGEEYLAYSDLKHAEQIIQDTHDDELRRIATNFRVAVIRDHHPRVFWRTVIERLGL